MLGKTDQCVFCGETLTCRNCGAELQHCEPMVRGHVRGGGNPGIYCTFKCALEMKNKLMTNEGV